MKENLINTFSSSMSFLICMLLITGTMMWTNKTLISPKIYNMPSPKNSKFL